MNDSKERRRGGVLQRLTGWFHRGRESIQFPERKTHRPKLSVFLQSAESSPMEDVDAEKKHAARDIIPITDFLPNEPPAA